MTETEILLATITLLFFLMAAFSSALRYASKSELLELRRKQKDHDQEVYSAKHRMHIAQRDMRAVERTAEAIAKENSFYLSELKRLGWEPPVTHHTHPEHESKRGGSDETDNGLDPFGVTGGTGIGAFGGLGGYGF